MKKLKHAIILAAGRGSRMGEMTDVKPKCMVELSGKPLIEWQLNAFESAGINDITIIAGYKSELLSNYGTRMVVNNEWDTSNMVVSLLYAKKYITEQTVISYSDIVYEKNAVEILQEYDSDFVIAYDKNWKKIWEDRFEDPLSDAESFKVHNNKLLEIGSRCKNIDDIQGQYMGLFKISPVGMQWIEELLSKYPDKRNTLDMTALIQYLISEGHTINAVPITGAWCEVDSSSDLRVAQKMVETGMISFDMKTKHGVI